MQTEELDLFLKILGLEKKNPDLAYLKEILDAHQKRVPYENFSKILYANQGARIPTLEEYLNRIQQFGFGATCFPRNIYLCELLQELGFDSHLLTVESNTKKDSHTACKINLVANGTRKEYVADLGLMSSFIGPFDLNTPSIEQKIGWFDFKFFSLPEASQYRIEIHRKGKQHRYFLGSLDAKPKSFFNDSIKATFEPHTIFMKSPFIYKEIGALALSLRERSLFKVNGEHYEKVQLNTLKEFTKAIHHDMNLPNYPVEEVIALLRQNENHTLFD